MSGHAWHKHLCWPGESSYGFSTQSGLRVGRFTYGLGLWQTVDTETAENFSIDNSPPVFPYVHQSGVFPLITLGEKTIGVSH